MVKQAGSAAGSPESARGMEFDEPFAAVYEELRMIASARLRRHQRGTMLDTTALVHEAYIKLTGIDGKLADFENKRHFFATAALAMRQILTDQARRAVARKRGGGSRKLTLDEEAIAASDAPDELLEIDTALNQLQALDAGLAETVNLKYFGGLTLDEIAELQGTSKRTVTRNWKKARAFLHAQIAE